MKSRHSLLLGGALLAAAATLATAQIERLTLDDMVAKTDGAIYATIVDKQTFRTDGPDGEEMYFTTITLEGRSLADARATTVDVTFAGGWISPDEGVFNSEAPTADDVRIGNRVVSFYKWIDRMGNGVSGNALYAAHGGLFRTVESPKGTVVLGRGDGYAVGSNISLRNLEAAVQSLAKAKK